MLSCDRKAKRSASALPMGDCTVMPAVGLTYWICADLIRGCSLAEVLSLGGSLRTQASHVCGVLPEGLENGSVRRRGRSGRRQIDRGAIVIWVAVGGCHPHQCACQGPARPRVPCQGAQHLWRRGRVPAALSTRAAAPMQWVMPPADLLGRLATTRRAMLCLPSSRPGLRWAPVYADRLDKHSRCRETSHTCLRLRTGQWTGSGPLVGLWAPQDQGYRAYQPAHLAVELGACGAAAGLAELAQHQWLAEGRRRVHVAVDPAPREAQLRRLILAL